MSDCYISGMKLKPDKYSSSSIDIVIDARLCIINCRSTPASASSTS